MVTPWRALSNHEWQSRQGELHDRGPRWLTRRDRRVNAEDGRGLLHSQRGQLKESVVQSAKRVFEWARTMLVLGLHGIEGRPGRLQRVHAGSVCPCKYKPATPPATASAAFHGLHRLPERIFSDLAVKRCRRRRCNRWCLINNERLSGSALHESERAFIGPLLPARILVQLVARCCH